MKVTVRAQPTDYAFDPATAALIVIDMERDFIEHGGFGEALGNDVTRLACIVPTVLELLTVCRDEAMMVVHTPDTRLNTGSSTTVGDCGPDANTLNQARSTTLTSGIGHTPDALISLPLESNRLTPPT